MPIRFFSWNIEHLKDDPTRLQGVAQRIQNVDPDVFGLLEIEGINVIKFMRDLMPGYDFAITDGPEVQEILVGWRRGFFSPATFTQKREFKANNPALRPGALFTGWLGNDAYNFLWLHTDSGIDAAAFGNRFEMIDKNWSLRRAIDKLSAGLGNLVVMGDLNTMGLRYPTNRKADLRVSEEEEIRELGVRAKENKMRLLLKKHPYTWKGGAGRSDLDHVIASDHLPLNALVLDAAGNPAEVDVRGWIDLAGAEQKEFLKKVSDHCYLIGEISTP